MQRHLVNVETPDRPQSVDSYAMGFTGRDRRLARDPQLVEWLGKVAGEQANGSRDWPEFNAPQLAQFLSACDVDLLKCKQEHADALSSMPLEVTDAEKTVPRFHGATFLASSAEHVVFQLRKRHNTASRG